MLALLADGPLAGREIEVNEPRPTLELPEGGAEKGAASGPKHRYRLATVDVVPAQGAAGATERIAVYAHCASELRERAARAA